MSDVAIQLALDLTNLDLARHIVSEVDGFVDRVEVGTPLLRKHGMSAIATMRSSFPESFIVADCKIMDCGRIETTLALEAGANSVVVQAAAPRATLEATCEAAARMNGYVMADALGVT